MPVFLKGMCSFCIRYIHDTLTLFKMNNAQWEMLEYLQHLQLICDSLSLSKHLLYVCTQLTDLSLHEDSTAVPEKKLVQM